MTATRIAVALTGLVAMGCSPDENASNVSAASRVALQVVESMNALAADVSADRRFQYRLIEACNLRTERLLSGQATERATFPVAATRARRFEYAPGLGYGLRVRAGRGGAEVSIFDADRIDAIREMERLLDALATACARVESRGRK